MLTGDASINPTAPVVCCTAEVLANMALRQGAALDAPYVVMDEFHFYADRDRGAAWQIPLLALPGTRFLLMSATLGNTAAIEERLEKRTGVAVAHVHSDARPVPLDFEYRETPIHETVAALVAQQRAPVYVVNFTQRECGELAQGLTSANFATREERARIADALAGTRFDTPYGKDLSRILRHGIGIHHAGLLPRYRLLVERLAQRGLLQVVCGTDTLGVGVNVPIRTVLFAKLSKYDGEKVALLRVREFRQIAGRAGRKGFDVRGSVVCQAPEHVIENRREAAKPGARKNAPKKKPPRGFVAWSRATFDKLIASQPEPLVSVFDVNHGLLVNVLQRPDADGFRGEGWRAVIELIALSHEPPASQARLRRRAAQLLRSLRHVGVVEVVHDAQRRARLRVTESLQLDFSLFATLSLYLVEAAQALDREAASYALELISLAEAILENPMPILLAQRDRARGELLAQLKAEGVPYEDRIARLETLSWPQPEAEFIAASFRLFAEKHPWVGEADLHPKGVAREMFEGCLGFVDCVRELGVGRSEGLLLRYVSQVHDTLVRSLPDESKTQAVYDAIAYFRTLVQGVDASLLQAWQALRAPSLAAPAPPPPPFDLALHERALMARVRAELQGLVRALAAHDWEAAAASVRADPDDAWNAERFEQALAPFLAEYGRLDFTPAARLAHRTRIDAAGPRRWRVSQVLVDPAGDELWAAHGDVDLSRERDPAGPLVQLRRIGP
jgi:superfamily II RNA helicase